MGKYWSSRNRRVGAALLVPAAVALQLFALPAAFGQTEPVYGLDIADDISNDVLGEGWRDPISAFGLADVPLAGIPEFDFRQLHASDVFEDGVENIPVEQEVDVSIEIDRHIRALQAVATAESALTGVTNDTAAAEASIERAARDIAENQTEIGNIRTEIEAALADIAILTDADDDEVAEQDRLSGEVEQKNAAIVDLAIQAFTGEDMALESIIADPGSIEVVERRILAEEVREFQREDIEGFQAEIRSSDDRRATIASGLSLLRGDNAVRRANVDALNADIERLDQQRTDLDREITQLEQRREALTVSLQDAAAFTEVTAAQYQIKYHERLVSFVAGTDVPLVALNAYVRAARTLSVEDSGCGIHWSQLAGIGRIESFHGYFGDSTLGINGDTTVDIRGLSLDGRVLSGSTLGDIPDATGRTEETGGIKRLALIRDTDNGVLDGDRRFDRAVGPMQFIPTTWRLYDADGNNDGVTDPQNIYDAALASARYLCDAPGSMLTPVGEQRAYFAYNHDIDYSHDVTNAGRRYHVQLDVSPEPGGFTNFARTPTAQQFAEAAAARAAADAAEAEAETQAEATEADVDEGEAIEAEQVVAEVLGETEIVEPTPTAEAATEPPVAPAVE